MINQYSFVLIGLLVILLMAPFIWRLIGGNYAIAAVALLVFALGSLQVLLRTDTERDSTIQSFEESLASGDPVLLILYSNF